MLIQKKSRCYFYQFSKIKWALIKAFFDQGGLCAECIRVTNLEDATHKGLNKEARLFFWGKKIDQHLLRWAKSEGVDVFFVEDGFIRSLGLGSALSRPLSIVLDSQGIYFDPNAPSDLETLLQNTQFSPALLAEAADLIEQIKRLKLSKYNHQKTPQNLVILTRPGQKILLVPGQVDDDMSVKFGAFGLKNITLLETVRRNHPEAYIVYKPHPDVLSNNRFGKLPEMQVKQFADQIITHASIDSVLQVVDEVHTMTSLVGFDALLRGKKVVTYGLPFYAGWGLTTDKHKVERRTRILTLPELVAAALILYPKYLNPNTQELTTPSEVIKLIGQEKQRLEKSYWLRFKLKLLGSLLPRVRNLIKRFR